MKYGSVYQRHLRACPRDAAGNLKRHRCRGLWAFQIDVERDSTGERKQVSKSGFPTKAAATAALRRNVDMLMADVDAHSLTLAEYLETWLAGKHALRPKTVSLYRYALDRYIVPKLGRIRLQDLRAHHLDAFYSSIAIGRRGKPLSTTTLRRIHSVLRSALGTAVKRRLIPYNPAEHIELAPDRTRRPTTWTVEQCQTFLRVSDNDPLAALYHLMLVTGMRRGEAIGLRWTDVHLDRQHLTIVQQLVAIDGQTVVGKPKTKRGVRVVPIDAGTVSRLRGHRIEQHRIEPSRVKGAALVFTRTDGTPLNPEFVTRHFQVLARYAALPVIRLHDLRHTNASLALAAGVDLKVVSDRLGHSTTAITADLYTHVDRGLGQGAAQAIADVLGADASAMQAQRPIRRSRSKSSQRPAPAQKRDSKDVSAGQEPAP